VATPTQIRRRGRYSLILGTLVAALMVAAVAYADNVLNDVATDAGGAKIVTVTAGGAGATVNYSIQNTNSNNSSDPQNSCNPADGSSATVTPSVPAGVTKTPASRTFTACESPAGVTFAAGASVAPGDYEITVAVSDSGGGTYNTSPATFTLRVQAASAPDADGDGVPDASDNCPNDANADQADADSDGLGDACDPNSYAPAVGTAAADANGNEGSPLSTSGSFTDADGNSTLTITKFSGLGTVTDNGDGTWSWSYTPNDNGSGSVVVEASDGEHTAASDSFAWSAANVAPTVGAITGPTTVLTNRPYEYSASATDPSSVDAAAGFSWRWDTGSGTFGAYAAGANPNKQTISFSTCGNTTIRAQAKDKDDGESNVRSLAVEAYDGSVQAPLKGSGVINMVQGGQVVPVKIAVGCGTFLSGLAPSIVLLNGDVDPDTYPGDPPEPVTESVSSADTNGTMREVDSQYIYNLRVPKGSKNTKYTIAIRPWGGTTGPVLRAVLQLR
jgi:hypothetical protein